MAPPRGKGDPLAELREGEPGPLYFISGKERFLVDRAVDLLRDRVLDPRTRDFNYDLFQGKDAQANRILQAARTLPMMARRRLVLVRDADEMKADELAALIPYVEKPCPETCLAFVAEKADQRLKFFSAFKKRGVMLKLDPLYERELPGFVREEARSRGVRLETGVAESIVDEVGGELGPLADAVERLCVYAGERKSITPADVEAVISTTRQRSVFELADAIGNGDRSRALLALGSLVQARESGVRIVAMLARHVRQLFLAASLLPSRPSRVELAQALGVPPFFVDGIEQQARRLGRADLERMHDALFRADRALKSSRLEDARILEGLILELTVRRGATPGASRRRG